MSRFNYPIVSLKIKIIRCLWSFVYLTLFRPSPIVFHWWRRLILVCFGAQIQTPAFIYPSVKIWIPSKLKMGKNSTLGPYVDCYCVDEVSIGSHSTISQYSYLCTASHDFSKVKASNQAQMPLISAPIVIENSVWVAADVFIGPGVKVGEGTVVLARSTVVRDLPRWSVASGSPVSTISKRDYRKL